MDANSTVPPRSGGTLYETERLVSEYLLFHYGSAADILGDLPGPREATGFASRLVRILLDPARIQGPARALDIGCAVGGSSFELARTCLHVLGIDYSHAFIRAAQDLVRNGSATFDIAVEGDLRDDMTVFAPDEVDSSRLEFRQGDAGHLPEELSEFDVVLAANLICRLPEPRRFLAKVPSLVRPGGQLLLTTPFTWLDEFTPREHWIGGTAETGGAFDRLRKILSDHFDLDLTVDIPFLIREHARKFQYTVAVGSRWIRKGTL